jgi:hypothetical protein
VDKLLIWFAMNLNIFFMTVCMIPTPWVRIEYSIWFTPIVLICLVYEVRSMKHCVCKL